MSVPFGFAALWVMEPDIVACFDSLVDALIVIANQLAENGRLVVAELKEIDRSIGYIDLECST